MFVFMAPQRGERVDVALEHRSEKQIKGTSERRREVKNKGGTYKTSSNPNSDCLFAPEAPAVR